MDATEFARREVIRNLTDADWIAFWRQNRRDALHFAALWLSGPTGAMVPDQVVEAARVFERFLNEQ